MFAPDDGGLHRADHSSAMVAAIGTGDVFSKGATLAPGSDWCRSQISTGDRSCGGEAQIGLVARADSRLVEENAS